MPLVVTIQNPNENDDSVPIGATITVEVPTTVGATGDQPPAAPLLVVRVTILNADTHAPVRVFNQQTNPTLGFTATFPNPSSPPREDPLRLDPDTAYLICATAKYTNASNVVTFGAKSIIRKTPGTATNA